MFLRTRTNEYMNDYSEKISLLKAELQNCEKVVIGAGAGLSAAAGFEYSGERFKRYFSDFEEKYGFHDMYYGGFYPYESPEEHWAFWSRYIYINRYLDTPEPEVFSALYSLVKDKDYFIITTNVDHQFQKVGFDKNRLFYTQGDYGLFQCSEPCCQETFSNEEMVFEMLKAQKDMRIPSELIPICPHCGKPLTMNLRSDFKFVEDEGWHKAAEKYENFLLSAEGKRVLFLELGVGYNTPGIIKYPFQLMVKNNPESFYASINKAGNKCPEEIEERSVLLSVDIKEALNKLNNKRSS